MGEAAFPHHNGRRRTGLPWFLAERHRQVSDLLSPLSFPSLALAPCTGAHTRTNFMDGWMLVAIGWRAQLARKRDGWMLNLIDGWMLVFVGWRVPLARTDAAPI